MELAEIVFMNQSQYSRRECCELPISNEEWDTIVKPLKVEKEAICETETQAIKSVNNIGNKDQSVNGFEINIKSPNRVIENLFT